MKDNDKFFRDFYGCFEKKAKNGGGESKKGGAENVSHLANQFLESPTNGQAHLNTACGGRWEIRVATDKLLQRKCRWRHWF